MTWKIEIALPQDAETLALLGANTFLKAYQGMMNQADLEAYVQEAFTPAKMAKELSDPQSVFFVAMRNDEPLGYCRVLLGESPACVPAGANAKLERIYLDPQAHGHGVGRRLYDTARGWAQAHGQKGLWLSVWDAHHEGQKFHGKMGFAPVGEESFQVGRESQRDIVMFRPL